ncbi:nuclear transport factor 2 family protein [Bacillus sp. UNC438CL73TsuS30]|uniref:nuclear transport factor 2 family protein n=1 Tax=Bacillus sp. UNC438CL73TsuS30 TaxID=1340434 RepID=UPI00047D87F8|nr:nuclear transport factor 2 family protein [Bacillus sp. UNC438CL73TsuS30]
MNPTRSQKETEVVKLFEDYSKEIKSHDVSKMKTYIKTATKTSDNKIEQHLKAMAQGPTPDISTYGIKMITDSLAIAQIETKYPNHSYTQNLAVYNENGQWKIIFGQPMTNSFIPLSDKSIDVK